MKKYLLLAAAALLLLTASGCNVGKGTPPVLSFDGIEITVGESRPYDLTSEGWEMTFAGGYMAIGELPGNTWLKDFMSAKKDDKTWAYIYIYNPNREKKMYGLSTINKVTLKLHPDAASYWTENTPLVNGIDFTGMDNPAIKEVMADYKLTNETDWGSLRYDDGPYRYGFSIDEESGILKEIQVELIIPKSYKGA